MSRASPLRRGARALAAGLLVAWIASAQSAAGQKKSSAADRVITAQSDTLLFERDRERLHPGDPLRISGIEQNGNDARSRTPALAGGDHAPTLLDPEEQHRRALAIYGERAFLTSPAMPRAGTPGTQGGPGTPEAGGAGPAEIRGRAWTEILGLALATILVGWFAMRHRTPPARRRAHGT